MKLTSQQVASVKQELGADPIEETNPAMETLRNAFGDHTFYLASDGLFVLEPADTVSQEGGDETPAEGTEASAKSMDEPAHLVRIAAWTDENKNALQPAPPQATDTVVDLAAAGKGNGANGQA